MTRSKQAKSAEAVVYRLLDRAATPPGSRLRPAVVIGDLLAALPGAEPEVTGAPNPAAWTAALSRPARVLAHRRADTGMEYALGHLVLGQGKSAPALFSLAAGKASVWARLSVAGGVLSLARAGSGPPPSALTKSLAVTERAVAAASGNRALLETLGTRQILVARNPRVHDGLLAAARFLQDETLGQRFSEIALRKGDALIPYDRLLAAAGHRLLPHPVDERGLRTLLSNAQVSTVGRMPGILQAHAALPAVLRHLAAMVPSP
ncbi:MAG: hypothetical protein AAF281_16300, partial [Pseudomonadota bacterium]